MTAANRILRSYGESITVGTAEGRGFISCLDADDAQIHKAHLAPGVTNNSKYLVREKLGSSLSGYSIGEGTI